MTAEMTAEEAAALRQPLGADAQAPADTVQLASSERPLRRRLPALQRLIEPFGERLRLSLTQQLRAPCEVTLGGVELVGPAGVRSLMPTWAVAAEMQWPPLGLVGYVALNHPCTFLLIELAYGTLPADVANVALPTRTRLTEVERQTVSPWLQMLAKEMAHAALPSLTGPVTASTLGVPLQLATPDDGVCVALPYHFEVGAHKLQLTFLLLPHVIEALDEPSAAHDVSSDAAALAGHIAHAAVEVAATLGTCAVPLEDVLSLAPGTILWLDRTQSDPLPITVEDTVKFFAQPVARHGALGVEIIARVP